MTKDQIIEEAQLRWGEWLEVAGEKSPQLLIELLATMVAIERDKVEYYKQLRKHDERLKRLNLQY